MDIRLKTLKKRKFKNPVLICGMPGSGYVGKLAEEHLINKFESGYSFEFLRIVNKVNMRLIIEFS